MTRTSVLSRVLPADPLAADVLLADGSIAVIRTLTAEDRIGLDALHDAVSDDNLRLRFFSVSRTSGRDYVAHLFAHTDDTVTTLVATVHEQIVAVATAERVTADAAEIAVLVADTQHGHGLGSLLLEHLAAACRDLGIREFVAEVLNENRLMLGVLRDTGFVLTREMDRGVVLIHLDIAASEAAIAAADRRESRSEARSLDPLLHPRTVALAGVRRDGTGIGHAVLESILGARFTGALYVVHPAAPPVQGVVTCPRFIDVPAQVDLAVIAVPAEHVLDAMRDAVAASVASVVVISSGFSELGEQGVELQHTLGRLARENSIRLVGPNCLGVIANDPEFRLNATFTRELPPPGGLAVASQSGGVGIALLDVAREIGLGVQSFVSLGNKADVSGNDLLAAWLDDPRVTAAALYLESFGNALKFARVARRFAEHKPLLAVVGGRSAGGQRAGASHTAAAATPAVGVDALFAQAGVIGCRSAESMAQTALLLGQQPLPAGGRVAILSNAGGMGVLSADAAEELGLVVPELSPTVRAQLCGSVAGTVGTSNPIDLGAGASAPQLRAALHALLDSDEVDALVVVLVSTQAADPAPLLSAVVAARARRPDVPVILVTMGGAVVEPGSLPGVTTYRSPQPALEALAKAVRYAEWLRVPRDPATAYDSQRASTARALAGEQLGSQPSGGWLSSPDATALLDPYGLAPVGVTAETLQDAIDAAVRSGFPVAVKVADPAVVHKTDRGLVRTGLRSAVEVSAAVRAFAEELAQEEVPVLVQPMVGGVELALGVVRDPSFGPLLMVAAGGVATNLWQDRVFLLPPISARDAARAVRSLRIWPLLEGYRGSERLATDQLERLIVELGRLVCDVPQLTEVDLNPVILTPTGAVAVDVKARLAAGERLDAGVPRRLRAYR